MSITLHCERCRKKIEAPDKLAGKWGKCPSCHNKVYIPEPETDEDIALAPLDETDMAKQKQMMAETFKLSQDILLEREDAGNAVLSGMSDKDLTKHIIVCLRQMADSDLDEADKTCKLIQSAGRQAIAILDRIALSEMPEPELADVPAQVLSGLIRDLRSKIS